MWAWIFFNSTMFGQFFKMGTNISSISLIFNALSFPAIDHHVASGFWSENCQAFEVIIVAEVMTVISNDNTNTPFLGLAFIFENHRIMAQFGTEKI